MKKIISVIAMLAMLFSTAAQAAVPSGYSFSLAGGIVEHEIKHEKSISHSGRASMHIMYRGRWSNNQNMRMKVTNLGMKEGEDYRLQFYTKGSAYWIVMINDWDRLNHDKVTHNSSDWALQTIEFTAEKSTSSLIWQVDDLCDYYIDDISLYQLDENGVETGDNLIINGDMETGDFTPTDEVSEIDSVPYDSAVELSWKNPTEDLSAINIYILDEETGRETLVKTVTPALVESAYEERSSALIDGLENGKLYTFILRTVDKADNLSEGVTSFGLPEIDEYHSSAVKADRVNDEGGVVEADIDTLVSGKIRTQASVINNTSSEPIAAYMMTAIYKNDVLIVVECDSALAELDGAEAELSATITAPDDLTDCELYSCVWGADGKILTESLTLIAE